jgi:hypothetical protein
MADETRNFSKLLENLREELENRETWERFQALFFSDGRNFNEQQRARNVDRAIYGSSANDV